MPQPRSQDPFQNAWNGKGPGTGWHLLQFHWSIISYIVNLLKTVCPHIYFREEKIARLKVKPQTLYALY